MELHESECPLCFGLMQLEERDGADWLFCPNGCPTEFEAPARKPAEIEVGTREPVLQARAAGS